MHDDRNDSKSAAGSALLQVEVAYATPEKQMIIPLQVAEGTTLFQAAEQSGISGYFPELILSQVNMGVFGKLEKRPRQRVLKDQERVEIYRPLQIDPKEVRKRRAQEARDA
jgi:putative ubiquitin-RnfH superfamily antitoxin RatB of RatAB toxin-antitoxin module